MMTLKVNDIEVSVPRGSSILQAAKKAGVYIPTLCHDERIKPYGACRVCLVADRRKPDQLVAACFTPARAGMEIVTDSPAVEEAVRMQIRMILVNHPLDCPVCEKAGECALQELVIRYDIRQAPFSVEPPARYIDRETPLIERNMTRCILCGRCVRICNEVQGCGELDFLHRGFKTLVGTDQARPLDCDFCGLCVSTCPVGAISDKLYKDRARIWNLERHAGPCLQCGLGCEAEYHLEDGRIRRIVPAAQAGKKGLLCVRGQFGWRAYENPSRLLAPQVMIDGKRQKVSWDQALQAAASGLTRIRNRYGAAALAVLTADGLTTEEAQSAKRLLDGRFEGAHIGSVQAGGYRSLCAALAAQGWSRPDEGGFGQIDQSDRLIVIGGGAAERHPVLKPLVNGFLRHDGKELIVLSAWPDILSQKATLHWSIDGENLDDYRMDIGRALDGVSFKDLPGPGRSDKEIRTLERFVSLLRPGRKTTVLIVPNTYNHTTAAKLAMKLASRDTGIIPLGAEVNSRGAMGRAGLLSTGAAVDPDQLLTAMASGRIRALYCLGEDPLEILPDPDRVRAALENLDLLICQNAFETEIIKCAHIVLPCALLPEKSGSICSMLNEERTVKGFVRPPGQSRPDLDILRDLACLIKPAATAGASAELFGQQADEPSAREHVSISGTMPYRLMAVPSIFGDNLPARQSPDLADLRRGLRVGMNFRDLEQLGLEEQDGVIIRTPFGSARAKAQSDAAIPQGLLLLRHSAGCAPGLSLIRQGQTATPAAIQKDV